MSDLLDSVCAPQVPVETSVLSGFDPILTIRQTNIVPMGHLSRENILLSHMQFLFRTIYKGSITYTGQHIPEFVMLWRTT